MRPVQRGIDLSEQGEQGDVRGMHLVRTGEANDRRVLNDGANAVRGLPVWPVAALHLPHAKRVRVACTHAVAKCVAEREPEREPKRKPELAIFANRYIPSVERQS